MPRLSTNDVREIIELLEDGINFVPKLSKVEKMRMRSKIREQAGWLQEWRNPPAEGLFQKLEEKLSTLFLVYTNEFCDKLKSLLGERTGRLRSDREKAFS